MNICFSWLRSEANVTIALPALGFTQMRRHKALTGFVNLGDFAGKKHGFV
jgi:hypothetical protein